MNTVAQKRSTAWQWWIQSSVCAAIGADQLQRGGYWLSALMGLIMAIHMLGAILLFNEIRKEEAGAETDQSG